MADISKITVNSQTYDIKDAEARKMIENLSGYTKYLGVTTTALSDGATTNPITIEGKQVTASAGDIANYGSKEFIFNGTAWQEFGDLSGLKALAYKDSASGSFTPSGNITDISTSVTLNSTTISTITGVGTLPSWTGTVANETLTIGWSAGSLPSKQDNVSVATSVKSASTTANFSGKSGTVSVS